MRAQVKQRKERIYLRVIKGGLAPADDYAQSRLREKKYHVGDVLAASLVKLRNPKFNNLVHRIGQLCAKNIDAFTGMDAHKVIKRLQLEGNIACDELGIVIPNVGACIQKIPQSISFDNMDEGEYHEVALAICRFIAERYWQDVSPEVIEQMAESMVIE